MDSRELSTLKEMLVSRGFTATDFETLGSPLDDTRMYTFNGILIVFNQKTHISEKTFHGFTKFAEDNNYRSGLIIVSQTEPSESVLGVICAHIENRDNPLVQVFTNQKLQFGNITKHLIYSVPHRLLNETQRADVLKQFQPPDNTGTQYDPQNIFPKIWCQDAQAKWIGARPDDIVEIGGWCVASGENKRWRICVTSING
jgi:DNA-directed RNA polymerase subunit H (RpoH/RPB5)